MYQILSAVFNDGVQVGPWSPINNTLYKSKIDAIDNLPKDSLTVKYKYIKLDID